MKFSYNHHYFPPAPSVQIRLSEPGGPFIVGPLEAIVDTGADASIVPIEHLEPLSMAVNDRKALRSQWGERRMVETYLLDLGIGDLKLPLIEVVADELGAEIILGRNALNKLIVTLHGPKRIVEIRA